MPPPHLSSMCSATSSFQPQPLPLPSSISASASASASASSSFRDAPSFNSTSSFRFPIPNNPSVSTSLLASLSSDSPISAASISSSDPPLLYFASDSTVSVYDLSLLRLLSCFSSPSPVRSFAFSLDASLLFTAHHDRRIRVWSPSASHRLLSSLPTFTDRLLRSPLPRNYVQVRRHRRLLWIEHADAVSALAASADFLYSSSWDKTVKIWRLTDGFRCVGSVPAHDDAINAIVIAPDSTVYTASADCRVRAWAPDGRKKHRRRLALVATLERHRAAVNALAMSPDGSVLYSAGGDRSIVVWEREEGGNHRTAACSLRGHARAIMCLAAVDDLVVSGSTDRTVRIWRRSDEGYECLAVLAGHLNGVRSVAACRIEATGSESGAVEYRVCSGSVDGEVRIWAVWIADKWGSD